ncbi:MAG: isopentenyl-diphosphate Delta-isomerase [Vicinamibacterales bacterium]
MESNDVATKLVLVDERDVAVGIADKLQAHHDGLLHRACSVFVFDDSHRLLLQRRADGKYHSGGLWSNTCCGHPLPGEAPIQAAHRRLREEMGFDCQLRSRGCFVYRADVGNGLIEHEYDHLFVGRFAGVPAPNVDEVSAWRWESVGTVVQELRTRPDDYTKWVHGALDSVFAAMIKEVR